VLCLVPFQSHFVFFLVQLGPCFKYAVLTHYRVDQSSNHPNITFSIFDWFDALSLLRSENTMTAFLSKANVGVVIGADIVRLRFAAS
jgi:hypothetical protein